MPFRAKPRQAAWLPIVCAKAAAAATEEGKRMRKASVYAAKLALISIPTGFLFALAVDLAGGHHQLHTFGTLVIAATPLAFHRPVVVAPLVR